MDSKQPNNQVISKKRVNDHGEVFTGEREVNAMLDLVKQETERIDSRFLEPACGNGNFLAEILRRKLSIVEKRYSKSQLEYERYAIIALSSIYGIELLKDNVIECRDRLLGEFSRLYLKEFKNKIKSEVLKVAEFILSRNILWGDALSLKSPDGIEPLVFSEWSAVNGNLLKRRDYTMDNLLKTSTEGLPLFSDLGDDVFIPNPVAEFPLTHFLEVGQNE